MDIDEALAQLDSGPDQLTEQDRKDLNEKGYAVLLGVIDPVWLEQLRQRFEELYEEEGSGVGHREEGARRLADLVNKGEVFDRLYIHPLVLAAVYHVIGRDFKLSSLNGRDVLPGQGLQSLHADWGTDYDGQFHVCNSIWLLDDFGEENGCTRLVPGTHRQAHPRNVLKDPEAPHPDEEYLIAPAGAVVVFNSHTWHSGTLNRSQSRSRRAVFSYYTAREHRQQLDQRRYLRYETWKRIVPAARYILDVDV